MNRHSRRASVALDAPDESRKTDWALLSETTDSEVVRGAIGREMHGWGGGLLVLGVLQLVPGTSLDHVWGVVLLCAAGMAFYFKSAALLPAYGVILGWAMISNFLSGELLWMGLGVFQAYFAFRVFQQFVILRRAAGRLQIGLEAESPHRAELVFPWAAFALTAASWIGFGLWFAVLIWYGLSEQEPNYDWLATAMVGFVDLAVLGLALAVSALLARYRFRPLSILVVIGAVLALAGFVAFMVLGS